ncbi:MAG: class I adenylate-forming enzyme family protein [Bacilli bacterium]
MNENYQLLLNEILNLQKKECDTPYPIKEGVKKNTRNALIDLEKNHNNQWAIEMFKKNENSKNKIAINYRGNKISYEEMYSKVYMYARSLKEMGFKKGDEVLACMSNTPEFIYLFLATSFIGATIHPVGDWFDKNYLISIINNSKSYTMFVTDDLYNEVEETIKESNIKNIVMSSLTDSFITDKNGNKVNPFEPIDSKFHKIEDKVGNYIKENNKIITQEDFLNEGKKYNGQVIEHCTLDDICSITYTSGTTSPGCPKAIRQSNRSYITLSRFKDSDISGMPAMKDIKVQAHIPTYTHMELSCGISDSLHCNSTIMPEPFYNKEFFPYSLLINKPNFVCSSAGFWVHLCKLLNYDKEWNKIKMPYLMLPIVTGEACSPGEEKFFNATSRKHSFGTEKLPFPLAPIAFSMGGGTTESSGIFVTLYKAWQDRKINYILKKDKIGLIPYDFVDLEVLNNEGKYCDVGEPGLLVANSPCNMTEYVDTTLNEKAYITDAFGKKWLKLCQNSIKSDKMGNVKMKGRLIKNVSLKDGTLAPCYFIEDTLCADTKNIMSCTVTEPVQDVFVCHIELQCNKYGKKEEIIKSCANRLNSIFDDATLSKIYFRLRGFEESFPLDPSGKRSITELTAESMDEKCISCNDLLGKTKEEENIKILKKSK